MAKLTAEEDHAWRALMRLTGALPQLLESDLARHTRLSLSEFAVLLTLSEAREGSRRMNDLAKAGGLSPSRTTRVVADLDKRGLVERRKSEEDGRGSVATITADGRRQIQEAHPIQIDRAKEILFDQLGAHDLATICRVLEGLLTKVVQRT